MVLAQRFLIFIMLLFIFSVSAYPEGFRGRGRWRGDIRFFHENDHAVWRSGRWFHGSYGGALGWWWIVGGVYYYYPARVAVIPEPVPYNVTVVQAAPPAVIQAAPPTTIQVIPPVNNPPTQNTVQPAQIAAPALQTWYYCDNPPAPYSAGYYPYVPSCKTNWRSVQAAQPTPTPPPPPPPPPPPTQ